jgi:2-keto-3-deoxy-L-rhamnonate aldolase RhmA
MRNSKILARTRTGNAARIGWLGHFVPAFIAHAANLGFDAIWLDLEHRPMDAREVQALLALFHLYDVDCLLRTPTREKSQLYRYLEDGATGLMVPHVSTPDEARDLVRKVKYPPVGDRGLDGNGLETNYGVNLTTKETFVEHALRETILAIQIETPEGLANVDEIAAVEGVDALYIGPGDMSIRMQHEPEDRRANNDQIMQRVAAAAQKQEKLWGFYAHSVDELRQQHQLGAQLLVWGIDQRLIVSGLEQSRKELDEVLTGER